MLEKAGESVIDVQGADTGDDEDENNAPSAEQTAN